VYMKIRGLQKLEEKGLPCPPYQIIAINEDNPVDGESYIKDKIKSVGIPNIKDDRIGVTIRVSLPEPLDKSGRHRGLHVIEEEDIIKRVLEIHDQYKAKEKVIIQHTVDARCSGAIRKDNEKIYIEAIIGDAPPLLQGKTTNYERWLYFFKWSKERAYKVNNKEVQILSTSNLNKFLYYLEEFPDPIYLEWSIAKNNQIYFYEYIEFKGSI